MAFLSHLFKTRTDDRTPYRPLWHRTVELARDPRWDAEGGIADSVPGWSASLRWSNPRCA